MPDVYSTVAVRSSSQIGRFANAGWLRIPRCDLRPSFRAWVSLRVCLALLACRDPRRVVQFPCAANCAADRHHCAPAFVTSILRLPRNEDIAAGTVRKRDTNKADDSTRELLSKHRTPIHGPLVRFDGSSWAGRAQRRAQRLPTPPAKRGGACQSTPAEIRSQRTSENGLQQR